MTPTTTTTTPPNPESPTFLQRLALAFVAFFYVLARADFALRVRALREQARAPALVLAWTPAPGRWGSAASRRGGP